MPHQSAINGRKSTGNPNPRYDHLNNQPNGHRGRGRAEFRPLVEIAADRGITLMSSTPAIDFLKSCVANEGLRHDLRISAAGYVAKFEAHPKAPKPYVPTIPEGFTIPRLVSVAACQEALAIITESVLSGLLAADAGDYLRKHVEAVLPSLQQSEVAAEIESLRQFIDGVEQARVIEHVPEPPPEP